MHVVLVHGSYLGAWSWEHVTAELERLGHLTTPVDLPISDASAGAARYTDVVVAAISATAERLEPHGLEPHGLEPPVLVGHSMAGLVVPVVASRVPVRRMIFVGGYLPRPGESVMDQRLEEPIDSRFAAATAEWSDLGDGVWRVGPATAREVFFHDAPVEVADAAIPRLRPQAYRVITEPTPLGSWPAVDSRYVVLRDDRIMNPDWGRRAARDRLGVEPVELDGGHCPLLSRPVELARLIDRLAA